MWADDENKCGPENTDVVKDDCDQMTHAEGAPYKKTEKCPVEGAVASLTYCGRLLCIIASADVVKQRGILHSSIIFDTRKEAFRQNGGVDGLSKVAPLKEAISVPLLEAAYRERSEVQRCETRAPLQEIEADRANFAKGVQAEGGDRSAVLKEAALDRGGVGKGDQI